MRNVKSCPARAGATAAAVDPLGGASRDQLSGGSGPDRVVASGDRTADRVRCGPGHDLVNVDLSDDVAADCETISRQLSRDTGTGFEAQHETQVEPSSAASGPSVSTESASLSNQIHGFEGLPLVLKRYQLWFPVRRGVR